MNFASLQSMNKTMPVKHGPKKIDHTGVQYELVGEKNESRYHVLDDAGLQREAEEIREARHVLMSMKKKSEKKVLDNAIRTDKAGKEKRKETEDFEEALKTKQYVAGVDKHLLDELLANDAALEAAAGADPDDKDIEYARNATHPGSWAHLQPSGLGVAKVHPDGRVEYGLDVVRDKFHQNVEIIEQLYHEREELKERVEQLESDLLDPERAAWIVRANKYGLPHSARHLSGGTDKRDASKTSTLEQGKMATPREERCAHDIHAATKSSKAKSKTKNPAFSAADFAEKLKYPDPVQVDALGPSKRLLADIDRYVQRRRSIELEEEEARKKAEKEMQAYEERRKKALRDVPKSGSRKNLEGVNERSQAFIVQKKENSERLRKYYEEQDEMQRVEASRALSDHIKKGVFEQEMTYDAQLAVEAAQRKERIEKRKSELMFTSKAPVNYDPQKKTYEQPLEDNRFYAPDPKEVIDNLDLSTLRWNRHLEAVKEKQRQREREEREYYGTGGAGDPLKGMNKREQQSRERHHLRSQRQEQAVREKENRRVAQVKQEITNRVNAPIPVSGRRLTAAAEKRASMVRDRLNAQKEKEEELGRKSEAKAKENEKMLSNLRNRVAQEEATRKKLHGNFAELSGDVAAAKAERTARENRARAKENQERLRESLKKRPSLYERHRAEQEKQNAVDRALGIVKDAVTNTAQGKENNTKWNDVKSESKESKRHDSDIDSKMLHTDPRKVASTTFAEILDGKEKALMGMKDRSIREAI